MNRNTYSLTREKDVRRFVLLTLLLSLLLSCFVFTCALAADTGVTNAAVILRKNANKQSTALQTIPAREEVSVLNIQGSWYKVRYGKYTGYVMKKYVKVSANSSVRTAEKISELGSAPGPMRKGDYTSDVKKLQKALTILGFYDGKIDGKYGDGTASAVKAYQKKHKLDADGIAGRDTVKSIFGKCSSTTMSPSLLAEESGGSSSGRRNPSSNHSSSNTVESISQIGSAPAPTKPGAKGKDVVKLQQALECLGYYNGAIDGVYGNDTVKAVKKFQRKRSMDDDGIAGRSTIRVLFGSSASATSSSSSSSSNSSSSKKYKTETLDWFKDGGNRVIPKNAVFTIKDVYTGRTFKVRRWAGANHIDAEPMTVSDTNTLKAIYGGSWSWRRRPILVMYNGHVYAASMNGMPHGTQTIRNNSFDGHFCIHFKNSKTHETKRVDPDHQNAVDIATKHSW